MENKYLEMPWSIEDTIENLKEVKKFMQMRCKKMNFDDKGETDAKEVAFDFDRAIEALKKQIPKKPLFLFGDIVVVDECFIGVIVKTWEHNDYYTYEVYVRNANGIIEYTEEEIERYKVRHKELNEEEMCYQNN